MRLVVYLLGAFGYSYDHGSVTPAPASLIRTKLIGKQMSELNLRLKAIMQEKSISATRLARISGVSQPTITKILNGTAKNPTIQTVIDLASALNVSVIDLVTDGEGKSIFVVDNETPVPDDQFVKIQDMKVRLSAGPGCEWELEPDEEGEQVAYKRTWFIKRHINPKDTFRMRVHGDSMEPYFYDGDSVLLEKARPGERIRSGKIYAFMLDGVLRVKRLSTRVDGQISIKSENRAGGYEEEVVPAAEFFERVGLLGRVIDRSGGSFL